MTEPSLRLVCLGGTLCDARLFQPLLDRLAFPADVWSHDAHDRVADAASALLAAEKAPFVVIGFSLGGFVALEALRQAPDRVRAVILMSGNAFPDAAANAQARRDDVAAGRKAGLDAFMRSRADMLVADPPGSVDVLDRIAAMATTLGDDIHARQAEMNIHRPDLRAVVQGSPRPILALAGEDDRVCPRDRYLDLARSPAVTLAFVEDAGHFLPLEAPDRCAELIAAFLKDVA
jgi:pimeloyl-ACP methyl ester carboxylesterase